MSTYFYGPEADMFTFFKIPKLLFSEQYKHISTDAKLLFGLMLDRMGLSTTSEGWTDPDGRVYIYYPVEEIMNLLSISDKTATKLYKELESVELIERKRQGLGKPAKIYVNKFFRLPDASEASESQRRKNFGSRPEKFTSLETKNFRVPPYKETEINKTDSTETSIESAPSRTPTPHPARKAPPGNDMDDMIDGIDQLRERIKKRIDFDALIATRPWDRKTLTGIVALMVDVCSSTRPTCRVGGETRRRADVRRRLLSLDADDIVAALHAMETTISNPDTHIRNMRAYLLTTLYNTPTTSAHTLDYTAYKD